MTPWSPCTVTSQSFFNNLSFAKAKLKETDRQKIETKVFHQAVKQINDDIKSNPRDADLLTVRILKYIGWGREADAVEDLNRLVQLAPNDITRRFLRGNVYGKYFSNDEKALEDFQFIIDRDPQSSLAHLCKAQCLTNMGRHQDAIDALDIAIKHVEKYEPPYKLNFDLRTECYRTRGALHIVERNTLQGINDLRLAVKLGGGEAQPSYWKTSTKPANIDIWSCCEKPLLIRMITGHGKN